MAIVLLIGGIAVLVLGAHLVVHGASALAGRLGLSPVVVGLTLVALATSLPEAVISLGGVWTGEPELAVGNAVGSNLFNILFILGAVSLLRPMDVDGAFLRREIPVLAVVTIGILAIVSDGSLSRIEGLGLVFGLAVYLTLVVRGVQAPQEPAAHTAVAVVPATVRLALGFGALAIGAHVSLQAALDIAAQFAVGERIVGLLLLGAGSSLPELVTSLVAVRRGENALAIGNVLGSCLFNLMFVLGLTGVLAPAGVDISVDSTIDLLAMAGAFLVAALALRSGMRLSRREGGFLIVNYVTYLGIAWLVAGRAAG